MGTTFLLSRNPPHFLADLPHRRHGTPAARGEERGHGAARDEEECRERRAICEYAGGDGVGGDCQREERRGWEMEKEGVTGEGAGRGRKRESQVW